MLAYAESQSSLWVYLLAMSGGIGLGGIFLWAGTANLRILKRRQKRVAAGHEPWEEMTLSEAKDMRAIQMFANEMGIQNDLVEAYARIHLMRK